MARRRLRAVLIGLAAGALAGAGYLAEPAIAAVPALGPASALATVPAAIQQVTLITGDVVTLTAQPDGRQAASVWRANPDGPSGEFQMFTLGSDMYVIPQSAVPYLGSTLDLSLFDVTQLAASGSSGTTVQVAYRSATAPQAVPGVTITSRSGTTARGM
ncbi:MAG: hypothetical protein J2P29_07945, partial [Actinobacteria bacterium]|nr:hypothetical protein [Actinomycetota bacterium]